MTTATCKGGPLDGQTIEVPPSLSLEVRFQQMGKWKTYVYSYAGPPWVAEHRPEFDE